MLNNETILRFEDVSFEYGHNKPILDQVSFSVRRGTKTTIMGQNGAGKSTIFGLITKTTKPESGGVHIGNDLSIAVSRQVIPRDELDLTVKEFFQKCFPKTVYDIDPKIDEILETVHLTAACPNNRSVGLEHDKIIKDFSGGQQARLLLASALIQDPDLLLLDEPTNNLDKIGIEHLTKFLIDYKKTCLVISHDADFLNAFTDGVLYLDVFTRKVEKYVGNYFDVTKQIIARVEKENRKNAQLEKEIIASKEKANAFAYKGGQMRLVSKRMREKAEELEEEKVEIRREDKTIRPFTIPMQADLIGEILNISQVKVIKGNKAVERKIKISLKRRDHLLIKGPNGIGKSTLLEAITKGVAKGSKIAPGVKVGYYRQDFSTLNFEDKVYDSLISVMDKPDEQIMRGTSAGFLITGELMHMKVGSLSEGQKGLVAFARLVLQKPGLLILDEPTNHINFRHLPIIAEALNKYEGAMILVSHSPDFVQKIRIDDIFDLEKSG